MRCVLMLSPHRPGWAKQRPDLFSSKLSTPALITWCPEDTIITGGPEENFKLWSTGCVQLFRHGGPRHRPLPADAQVRETLVESVVKLIVDCCGSDTTPSEQSV